MKLLSITRHSPLLRHGGMWIPPPMPLILLLIIVVSSLISSSSFLSSLILGTSQSGHIKDLSLLGFELPTLRLKAKYSTTGPKGHFDSESLEVSMILPFSLVPGVALNVTLSGLVKTDLVVLYA